MVLHLFSESKPKTCHPEEEAAKDKDWSQLGAFLSQVKNNSMNKQNKILNLTASISALHI